MAAAQRRAGVTWKVGELGTFCVDAFVVSEERGRATHGEAAGPPRPHRARRAFLGPLFPILTRRLPPCGSRPPSAPARGPDPRGGLHSTAVDRPVRMVPCSGALSCTLYGVDQLDAGSALAGYDNKRVSRLGQMLPCGHTVPGSSRRRLRVRWGTQHSPSQLFWT